MAGEKDHADVVALQTQGSESKGEGLELVGGENAQVFRAFKDRSGRYKKKASHASDGASGETNESSKESYVPVHRPEEKVDVYRDREIAQGCDQVSYERKTIERCVRHDVGCRRRGITRHDQPAANNKAGHAQYYGQ